ncbi:MAG: XTP/dITP diphosphatase [Verrucomicrobia bacterium]|nr:XTP/dITP diphosphatase [Verrucomicrobiota bacterium]
MKLLIATRNRHKAEEILQIFNVPGLEVVTALDFSDLPDVEEDKDTFEGNAIKKAVAMAKNSGLWAMADDSGLEVDALGGEPGVYSARFAGEPVDYDANNAKLLIALAGVENRTARFRCVVALSDPDGNVKTVEAKCEGLIDFYPKGDQGFGYDPLFIPEGKTQTFAELPPEEKHAISHRGRALQKAHEQWADTLRSLTLGP